MEDGKSINEILACVEKCRVCRRTRNAESGLAHHRFPAVMHLFWNLPAIALCVCEAIPKQRRLVHQLFGDAPDIDARPPEPPRGS